LLGLTPAHSIGDLARGVLESISYAVRANLEALEATLGTAVDTILFTGGASRSRLTCQLLADVIGRPVVVPNIREPASAGGAALVAGQAAVDPAQRTTFTADPERHRDYCQRLAGYLAAYARLQDSFGT
jgi:sugar (pentulose or hexulose) kinase